MEPVVAKFRTFEEADKASRAYYLSLTPEQRWDMMGKLWEAAYKDKDGSTPRLARIYRIVELPRR